MVDIADTQNKTARRRSRRASGARCRAGRSRSPRSSALLVLWEIFGRHVNPIFGSYPSAIAVAFWELLRSGQLWSALIESLQPFFVGYGLAIVIGVPVGLVIGRFRTAEAAFGIYVTAGYAMPLVALVPLLILWLGLGFKVKVAVVFLMSLFPICINTWLGVTAVPKTLIEVGKSFVAPDIVILRRIILPATLPYIMAGIRLAVGRAVVAMVIAEFFTTISGLGAVIINSANNFDTATMFVPIIILMVMAVGLNWPDRLGRAQGRALAGGDRRAGSRVVRPSARTAVEQIAHLRSEIFLVMNTTRLCRLPSGQASSSTGGCARCCTNCTTTGPWQPSTSRKPFTRSRSGPRSAISVSMALAKAGHGIGVLSVSTKLPMPSECAASATKALR